ncbi:MAG: SDR family NAD(P)-dependent oxidoreductase [Steroidobacteraceae bacterium]|jgi:NAD(P)-dependent dehydrogenase (short-subunit alcohol dehydrogenase family)|nr:SDR family oxidoreductase [Gammaproteobacteria bacterium]
MQRLRGKVALVTGAGRRKGLGEAICRRLLAEGAKVVVSDIGAPAANLAADRIGTNAEMQAVVDDLRRGGGEVIACTLDVRDEAQVESAVATAVAEFGALDILVNNAGIGFLMEPLIEMPKDRWQTVLEVNLMGAFLCSKHAARRMIAQGNGGRIVNIASVAAKSGSMHLAAYAASKHGMVGLTRSAALELGAHRITVNAVCPNHVTTGLGALQNEYRSKQRGQTVDEYLAEMRGRIPLGRVGLAEDTAKAVAFLCSDEAQYVTGEAMNVSGGQEMH